MGAVDVQRDAAGGVLGGRPGVGVAASGNGCGAAQ